MADRFQDRPLPDDLDRIDPRGRGPARGSEGDPLAELARLIGQNDPFGGGGGPAMSRANPRVQPRGPAPDQYRTAPPPTPGPVEDPLASGPPPWMQRSGGRHDVPRQPPPLPEPDYPQEAVHPQQRYAAGALPQPQYRDEPAFDDRGREQDGARYDDALFGQLDTSQPQQGFARDAGFQDDPYAFQDDGYDEAEEEDEPRRRGNGLAKVAVVIALAVIGTGAAFAYRSYMNVSRSGEPPIIRADNTPTKIIPATPADGVPKLPDRMASGDQGEKIVSREETPVDVNSRSVSPRVVFPPLNQASSANAASIGNVGGNSAGSAGVAATADTSPAVPIAPTTIVGDSSAAPSSGTLANSEPRRIKTLSVHGDQPDASSQPPQAAAAPPPPPAPMRAARAQRNPPSQANASANAPMSLSPQQAAPAAERRMAAANPAQDTASSPSEGDSGYLVQISSQRSEADAQASFRALKAKYPDVMGSYSPVIKRVELAGKGVMYRAMVGPFDTASGAVQFCTSLKTAGGQCFVPRKN